MPMARRELLKGVCVAGLGAVAGGLTLRADTGQRRAPLALPPLEPGRPAGVGREYDLELRYGWTEFLPGRKTPTMGVNAAFLGPTVRCRAGEKVTMNVKNALSESVALHWHGLHVPAKADGGPHQSVMPGGNWSPSFEIRQKAGLFWYHSHTMHRTGEQVNAGLAGLILVEDEESKALGLPSEYGVDDIPLVIQDRRFRADGQLDYRLAMHDTMMGFKGDTILVNGTVNAELTVVRRRTRLRLLNGSNSRIYNIGRSDGRALVQIASDGSLLEQPVQRRTIRLAPGERAEALLDMEPDSAVSLVSYPDAGTGRGGGMMMRMMGDDEELELLHVRSGKLEASDKTLPARLIDVPSWDPRKADRNRTFTLEMGMMGMMGGGRGRGMMGGRMGGMSGMGMTINGRAMDMERIDERVSLGATEIWTIRNATPMAHPFHIHDIQFRILDRDGAPAAGHERGLKDTVLVDPGESVRVITQFTDYADPDHPYMYHCHILEHEDAGMMGQFLVV